MSLHYTLGMFCLLMFSCVNSQENTKKVTVGGPCEGCEALYEYGESVLSPIDTLPGFRKAKEPIMISGKVFQADGITPAKDVILYFYHTDEQGVYPKLSKSKGWENRHGYLRGWIKTTKDGTYTIYTNRPASYPNSRIPQHIHITVLEPGKNPYYINDFYFSDDPYLTQNLRERTNPRGGSGVIKLQAKNSIKSARRDIILGKNIPNYE